MAKAFVLINCELGSEKQVISDLKKVGCVKNVYGVFGAYDIVTNLECERLEELRQMIILEIRKIGNVRSTITLMGIDGQC
ncbi:MAG: Lrp/AsnC family transcriptional regulator [Nitrosopumilus sp.]|nr:Lrp/AsnC family transcriptional regulator [Nitrosopumilus sp.]